MHVEGCVERTSATAEGYDVVTGCVLTIADRDLSKLVSQPRWRTRPASAMSAALTLPAVGKPYPIAQVYFTSPPEDWDINDVLIYTDAAHTRVTAYLRQLKVH